MRSPQTPMDCNRLTNNQKALELGEKYHRLSAANKYLHYNVREAFEVMIVEFLEKIPNFKCIFKKKKYARLQY